MNIADVESIEVGNVDSYRFLYDRQYALYLKYKEIEEMPNHYPLNIHTLESQVWIKDFMWRVTEELVEAVEAFEEDHHLHKIDELSDALHFYTEIYVLLGQKDRFVGQLDKAIEENSSYPLLDLIRVRDYIFKIIYSLAFASNQLRNRKWKKTQVFVDEDRFYHYLDEGYFLLISLILRAFTEKENNKESLLNLYYLKNQVNHFRQRSNY